ncbi:MAG: ATP-binding protein [Bacteroidota bacterium]|nr:ATP-binding protein [Bacteroidota bacterium]
MKVFLKIGLFFLLSASANAQVSNIDSLQTAFINAPDGPLRYKAASNIYFYYQEINRDSALNYAEQQLLIGKRKNNKIAQGVAFTQKSYQLMGLGKYAEALKCLQQAFVIAEDIRNENEEQWNYFFTPFHGNTRLLLLSYTHHMYALLMLNTENLEQQIIHFKIAGKIGKEINYAPRIMLAYLNLGASYLEANKPDSALYFAKEAERVALQSNDSSFRVTRTYLGTAEMHLGDIYKALKKDSMSLAYYHKSLHTSTEMNNRTSLSRVCSRLTTHHLAAGNKDSALYYSLKNLTILQTLGQVTGRESNIGTGYELVYLSYKMNNQFDSAFKYQGLALVTKDSLAKERISTLAEFQNLTFSEQLRLQSLEKEKVVYQNKVRTYFMLAGIGVLLLLAIVFYRNNLQKNKAKLKIEQAYDNLKETQQQLIQSEKMASLGELTAGIAHEIQNPLNFVNNFSEVSTELVDEMNEEMAKGNYDDAKVIANDVKQNLEKINHHGKRAGDIVKGMLQHSQKSSGQKEPTDINALCDEYLRLSYHGLRAKDKSFNATMKTDFDKSIGKINIVPQDIGRVILNLLTNAFYVVNEKKQKNIEGYEPTVSINTKRIGDKVEISVSDNGNGIPKKVLDKIFQPFFTTKPTGQGTGLGLSLSYDIVKAHGGELKVETKEGEGSEFIICLSSLS